MCAPPRRFSVATTARVGGAYGDEDPDAIGDWLVRWTIVIGGGCLAAVVILVPTISLLVARCTA